MNQRPIIPPEPPVPELGSLPRDLPPPPDLESRVVDAMRAHALLKQPRRSPWLQVAAAILLVAGGVVIGRMLPAAADRPPTASASRFLLMLTGATVSGDDAARAESYRRWAIDVRSAGHEITGERLANSGIGVMRDGSAPVANPEVQGYFVVSAIAIEDAVAVAQSSPHVQSGGLIIVRPIDTP